MITNNRMSSETKAYAKQLGVELITEHQFNEITLMLKTKKVINEHYTGLTGIIISMITHRPDLLEKSVNSYSKEPVKTDEIMLMYGKEAGNRKQEIDRQHHTIPNQRPKDKHCENVHNRLWNHG